MLDTDIHTRTQKNNMRFPARSPVIATVVLLTDPIEEFCDGGLHLTVYDDRRILLKVAGASVVLWGENGKTEEKEAYWGMRMSRERTSENKIKVDTERTKTAKEKDTHRITANKKI